MKKKRAAKKVKGVDSSKCEFVPDVPEPSLPPPDAVDLVLANLKLGGLLVHECAPASSLTPVIDNLLRKMGDRRVLLRIEVIEPPRIEIDIPKVRTGRIHSK